MVRILKSTGARLKLVIIDACATILDDVLYGAHSYERRGIMKLSNPAPPSTTVDPFILRSGDHVRIDDESGEIGEDVHSGDAEVCFIPDSTGRDEWIPIQDVFDRISRVYDTIPSQSYDTMSDSSVNITVRESRRRQSADERTLDNIVGPETSTNLFILHAAGPGFQTFENGEGGIFTRTLIRCINQYNMVLGNCAEILAQQLRRYVIHERNNSTVLNPFNTRTSVMPNMLAWPFLIKDARDENYFQDRGGLDTGDSDFPEKEEILVLPDGRGGMAHGDVQLDDLHR